jgi:hypothetical protein
MFGFDFRQGQEPTDICSPAMGADSAATIAFQKPVPLSVSMLYGNVTIANFILKPLLMAISEWRERSLVIFPLPHGRYHLHSL